MCGVTAYLANISVGISIIRQIHINLRNLYDTIILHACDVLLLTCQSTLYSQIRLKGTVEWHQLFLEEYQVIFAVMPRAVSPPLMVGKSTIQINILLFSLSLLLDYA